MAYVRTEYFVTFWVKEPSHSDNKYNNSQENVNTSIVARVSHE